IKHRVLVECKDEKRAVDANQRVMQFQGLLSVARNSGEADAAEIVTRIAWGDAAKGFAHKAGISLLTYTEKVSQLLDFTSYLNSLITRFDIQDDRRPSEPPLGGYYVNAKAELLRRNKKKAVQSLDEYLLKWSGCDDGRGHIAILGEYGTGKTSLCHKLARDLAEAYINTPASSRIPIVLNLRDFT